MNDPLSEYEAALGQYLEHSSYDDRTHGAFLAAHPHVQDTHKENLEALHTLDQMINEARVMTTVPNQVNSYRLLRCLGRGGMGTVYLAEHGHDQRLVALKLIERSLTHGSTTIQRFTNEALLGQRLRHPNLVTIYEHGQDSHYAYFAMEFVPGMSLAKVISQVRVKREQGERLIDLPGLVQAEVRRIHEECGLEEDESVFGELVRSAEGYHVTVARIVSEIADGLHYLHEQKVVHRDVKPENILLDGTLTPYVTDFGLAKDVAVPGLTRTGAMLGTIPYMSPEMASEGAQSVDHRTDVYSLGVTLYELLTLRTPHQARSTHEMLRKIGIEIPACPRTIDPSIPRELEAITLKAIETSPARRYSSARALAEDLRRFIRLDPVGARAPGLRRMAARYVQRHRLSSSLVGVLILAVSSWWIATHYARAQERSDLLIRVRQHHADDRLAEMGPLIERIPKSAWTPEVDDYARLSKGMVQVPFSSMPPGAEVWAVRLDSPTGTLEDKVVMGKTAAEGSEPLRVWLNNGTYRIVMVLAGFGSAEYMLHVPWKRIQRGLDVTLRKDEDVTVGMVEVSAGSYRIGYDPPSTRGSTLDLDERTVKVDSYYIDAYEVSNLQYHRFVRETEARNPWPDDVFPEEKRDHPITNVTWDEAREYAEWAGKRLPTEIEWEISARGAAANTYPWGNDWSPENANIGPPTVSAKEGDPAIRILPKPSGPVAVTAVNLDLSPCGAHHMAGNVREWVFDYWVPRAGVQAHEAWQLVPSQRVVRGSSYLLPQSQIMTRSSMRGPLSQLERRKDLGFRCAKSKLF